MALLAVRPGDRPETVAVFMLQTAAPSFYVVRDRVVFWPADIHGFVERLLRPVTPLTVWIFNDAKIANHRASCRLGDHSDGSARGDPHQ